MCMFCDRKEGIEYARLIIERCEEIIGGYKAYISGHIKPHSKEMGNLVLTEKSLVRLIIDDIL